MERVEDQKHGSRGIITNIQRLCTHDGPGSRTTVFFKGCPFSGDWMEPRKMHWLPGMSKSLPIWRARPFGGWDY